MYHLSYTVNFPEGHVPYELNDLNGGRHDDMSGIMNTIHAIHFAFPGASSFVFIVTQPNRD